jgi:hypothetical protein
MLEYDDRDEVVIVFATSPTLAEVVEIVQRELKWLTKVMQLT